MTVGVLIIYRAANQTVMFEKVDYIRVGSYTKKLNEYPTLQAQLWDRIRNTKFEERYAKQDLELADALRLLDYAVYFDIRNIPQPTDNNGVAHYMMEEGIIVKQDNGLFAITNLGAILLTKRLSDFPRISRKAIRVVQYQGNNRLKIFKPVKVFCICLLSVICLIIVLLHTKQGHPRRSILYWIPSVLLCKRKRRSLQSCNSTATKAVSTPLKHTLT